MGAFRSQLSAVAMSLIVTAALPCISVADWPCYRADARRSGATDESLKFPLAGEWTYTPAQPPRPAWPEPGRMWNVVDFDYAFQPVVAGGLVFFGSSADDSVRALNLCSGKELWRFTGDAPFRFAPHIADGRCYAAGDDGHVYCLDAKSGKPVWRFHAAFDNRFSLGNERMISRTPCRSGVLVVGDTVYATAGMWPSEGVLIYALDADTGKVKWCNDTSYSSYIPYPHKPSRSFGGPAPQGYLLAAGKTLLVPTGKAQPAAFDISTGKLRYYAVTHGGTWVTVVGDYFFAPRVAHRRTHQPEILGEIGPRKNDGLCAHRVADGKPTWPPSDSFYALLTGATDEKKRPPFSHGLADRHRLVARGDIVYAFGEGLIEALDCSNTQDVKRIWQADYPRAYSAALAGNTLIAGGTGTVVAWDATTGRQIWKESTDGQVRGLAVADGRLIASTHKGTLYAFSSGREPRKARRTGFSAVDVASRPHPSLPAIMAHLPGPGARKGYALIVGEADARLAEALAERSSYHVICVLSGERALATERRRLIEGGSEYGSRIALHLQKKSETFPYAQYFANVVVVSGDDHGVATGELYRVLRPSGGLLIGVNAGRAVVDSLQSRKHIAESGVRRLDESVSLTRAKLAGAYDWNSTVESDELVKWPLELLWFGGPGPNRTHGRHWKSPTPIFANGRCFARGTYHLVAIDAYNGCELWSWMMGGERGYLRTFPIAADDDNVYVNYTDYTVRFDAATGRINGLFGERAESETVVLDRPRTFAVADKHRVCGQVTLASRSDALQLTLRMIPPPPMDPPEKRNPERQSWMLHFDFREPNVCFVGESPGLFRFKLDAETGERGVMLGPAPPPLVVKEAKTKDGFELNVLIPWKGISTLVKGDPAGFRFAATLYTGPPDRRYDWRKPSIDLFADGMNSMLNNGWAVAVLDKTRRDSLFAAAPPVPVGELADLPESARTWPRQPTEFTAGWTIDEHDKLELPAWPPAQRAATPAVRRMPLTGVEDSLTYTRSYGCAGTISSATLDFLRSGTMAIYDRADDSGMRNFPAIRPGCGMTMVPAGGLLVAPEGIAGCTCPYNFQTSIALAPAARRRNEDWAMFNGKHQDALITHAALNLGAPGDRRSDDGTLWLHYPRQKPALEEKSRYTFEVPLAVEYNGGAGPYRFNADRTVINGTDKPWLFASGYLGLKTARLDLFYDVPQTCLALESTKPPTIDGKLDDACWNGVAPLSTAGGRSEVFLRQDEEHLYVAAKTSGAVDRRGNAKPFEALLLGKGGTSPVRLKVNGDGEVEVSGAAYGFDVPRVKAVVVDGKNDDWGVVGLRVPLGDGASCRFGWNKDGLLVTTESGVGFHQQRTNMTGIFIMVMRQETTDYYELTVDTGTGTCRTSHRIRSSDEPPRPPVKSNTSGLLHWGVPYGKVLGNVTGLASACMRDADGTVAEALFPWDSFKIEAVAGVDLTFMIMCYDPKTLDLAFGRPDFRPRILKRRATLCRLRLADTAGVFPDTHEFKVARHQGKEAFELFVSAEEEVLGNPKVRAAVMAHGAATRTEMAVSWRELKKYSVAREKLRINVNPPAQLKGQLDTVVGRFGKNAQLVHSQAMLPSSGIYTVRLCFAEQHGAGEGERVFDIVLQGKTVARNVDVVKKAGGRNTALVKEFRGVRAGKSIDVELVARAGLPVLSALEAVRD